MSTDILLLQAESGRLFLETSSSIVVVHVSMDGTILAVNKHASSLIGEPLVGQPWHTMLLNFAGTMTLSAWLADTARPRLLNIHTTSGPPQTLQVTVESAGEGYLLIGEVDFAEQAHLSQEVLALNRELNNLSRELALRNDDLRQLGESLELRVMERTAQLREANETLEARVAERTAALEDSLRAIRESEQRYRAAIQTANDAIVTTDEVGHIVSWNRGAENIFGYSECEVTGLPMTILIPKCYADGHSPGTQRLTYDDESFVTGKTVSLVGLRKDRIEFPLELSQSTWEVDGKHFFTFAIRDITDRIKNEQQQISLQRQLSQAQKMETIGHLTGGIAHDFNNILAIMLGHSELLQMSAEVKENQRLGKYLGVIVQAGKRGGELVAQLLTFSEKKEAAKEAIDVALVVREVAKLLRSTLPTSIAIKTEIASSLPLVLISPVKIHQILMNLGINARDAMAGVGTLEIKVADVVLNEAKTCDACHRDFSGSYLMLTAKDSGSGISTENLTKIFDPFFTTKEVGRGTGLGLSVLHGIVHSASGHVTVLTKVGQGTEFRVYLPAQLREANGAIATRELKPEAKSGQVCGKVMVVDDEASIVGFLTVLLEDLGCSVIGLTSAAEALRVFQEDPSCVDMVIADQTMPGWSGADLASAMLARRPDLPIVISTDDSDAIDDDTARKIGVRRFLMKPVPAKVLADIVAEFLAAKSIRA